MKSKSNKPEVFVTSQRTSFRSFYTLLSVCMLLSTINVHAQLEYPPDYLDDSPKMFYENKGQIIDDMDNVRNDVKYYTTALSPNIYLFDDAEISFVQVNGGNDTIPDTLSRIDFQLVGKDFQASAVSAMNKSTDYRNYYLPHCSSGATYCHAYEQFNYREVYPNIDFEVRANKQWGKYYFIVHPGGNPSDIEFQFTGQDSANIDPYWIELYYHTDILELPNAIAYELNSNGTFSPVNWSPAFLNLGNGKIGFQTGSYNTNKVLVIQLAPPMPPILPPVNANNLEWSTYYQSNGLEWFNDIEAGESNHIWVTGRTNSNTFPATNGTTLNANGTDATLIHFNDIAQLQWVTIIGGDYTDVGNALAVTSASDAYLVGRASINFPTNNPGGIYFDGTSSSTAFNSQNGFAAKFDLNGIKDFATYLGDQNTSNLYGVEAKDITISDVDNRIYIVGRGFIDNAPTISTSLGEGFVLELDANFSDIWSTQYGNSTTAVNSIVTYYNDTGNELFITGETSGGITEKNDINPSAYQSNTTNGLGNKDAFVAKFKINRTTDWETYYGGSHEDVARKIILNNNSNNITICGYTISSDFDHYQGNANFIQTTNAGAYDAFFLQFNRSSGQRTWATYYGGSDTDEAYDLVEVNNTLYFTGLTNGGITTTPWTGTNFYYDNIFNNNYSSSLVLPDAFIIGFDNTLDVKIATYFGGKDEDKGHAITATNNNKFYIAGFSSGANVPTPSFPLEDFNPNSNADYYKNTSTSYDGFIARFSPPFVVNTEPISNNSNLIQITPNPNNGVFNIGLSEVNAYNAKIYIYQSNGQLVQKIENINTDSINITIEDKGFYFVKIIEENNVYIQSVLVQ